MRAIVNLSIRFRLLVLALAAGIMIVGALQLSRMPADVLPETSPVVVDVQTEALGLSGPEVESLVTVPLEKELLEGVMGVTDVTSDSVPGLPAIELHFAPGTSLYHARQLVQERHRRQYGEPVGECQRLEEGAGEAADRSCRSGSASPSRPGPTTPGLPRSSACSPASRRSS